MRDKTTHMYVSQSKLTKKNMFALIYAIEMDKLNRYYYNFDLCFYSYLHDFRSFLKNQKCKSVTSAHYVLPGTPKGSACTPLGQTP